MGEIGNNNKDTNNAGTGTNRHNGGQKSRSKWSKYKQAKGAFVGKGSHLLQNKLKASSNYTEYDNNCDVAVLLNEIKTFSSKLEENTSMHNALHEAKVKFCRYQQKDNESLADYMQKFKDLMSSVKYHGGDIFFDKDTMKKEIKDDTKKNITKATTKEYRIRIIEKAKAVAFLKSANRK